MDFGSEWIVVLDANVYARTATKATRSRREFLLVGRNWMDN